MTTNGYNTTTKSRETVPLLAALALLAACGSSFVSEPEDDSATGAGGASSGTSNVDGLTGGGDGAGGQQVCKAEVATAQQIPLNLLIVLDRSASMSHGEWSGVMAALDTFFSAPTSDGVEIGLNFFPKTGVTASEACDSFLYDEPLIPFGKLPSHYGTLLSGLAQQHPAGSTTPTWGALKGSLLSAVALQDARPNEKVALVLASDGKANGCQSPYNEVIELAKLAASARNYNGVETYTIAMKGASLAELDQIAQAGGTAHSYDVTNDVSQFAARMTEIRNAADSCDYLIPTSSTEEFDALALNVRFAPDGAAFSTIPHAESPFGCGMDPGWYYDHPSHPTRVRLCPKSCSILRQAPAPEVVLEFGCPTVIK